MLFLRKIRQKLSKITSKSKIKMEILPKSDRLLGYRLQPLWGKEEIALNLVSFIPDVLFINLYFGVRGIVHWFFFDGILRIHLEC